MKKQFTWESFDREFIKSVVYSEKTPQRFKPGFDTNDKISLIPFMDAISSYPDAHFIRRYRNELTDNFIAEKTHLVSIAKYLERQNYRGIKVSSMDEMLDNFKRLRLTATVVTAIRTELLRKGEIIDEDQELTPYSTPLTIDLTLSPANELPLFDYQKEAVQKLENHFLVEDKRAGVLVMPTGSGKTRVATRFLLQDLVAAGWQIIWLTHRNMLVEQTADSVYLSAPIVKLGNKEKHSFKMVCVSGEHATVRATEPDDDVIIFSIQSLVRNLPFLQAILKEKVMVIVDEAHHMSAPSYMVTINKIKELCKTTKLLGLTATPIRMREGDTAKLMRLFDNNIIHSISMSELIAKGVLAEPKYIRVDTNINYETIITLDEKEYIRKWGELPQGALESMARTKERNELIIETYMKNRNEYGKTLIFALNIHHCISLCEELQRRGVKCDYIYSGHNRNSANIERFRNGDLDVLVNVQIMTEGSDVPDIQTVFLTRPTSSDVLLMQMIGRGMRGKDLGGTETVNIVDFNDMWGGFQIWLNPKFILEEIIQEDETISPAKIPRKSEMVPWAMFRDLLDGIHTTMSEAPDREYALPVGWYDVIDEDGNDTKVLVFQSQLEGYKSMWDDKKSFDSNDGFDGEDALHKYFDGLGLIPTPRELQLLIDTSRLAGEMPHLYPFSNRKKIDASVIADRLKIQDARISEINAIIEAVYSENTEIIDSIYVDLEQYSKKVKDFINYPDGKVPLGSKIEEIPLEDLTLDMTPAYDIKQLVGEVIEQMFDGVYGEVPEIVWTGKVYRGYYGKYFCPKEARGLTKPFIRINRILNSKDVPVEVVKYVIYHELLHRDNMKHDKAFRAEERKYPDWTEHERFLDYTFNKYDIRFDM